ncbi:MAG: TonB-dependent receptor [Akkermansiaceae bacterium]|jgi:vitamin B12 transporter|nr:TonB-dependent receptor [Akkermansiaceae bacterium]
MKKNIAATALLTTVGGLAFSHAAPESESQLDANLEETTILANRSLTDLSKVGSSVTVLDVGLLEREGILSVDQALKFVPGAISESTGGQNGTISSLFLRGTATQHAHLRVDGMRLSGANISSGNFLGGSGISGLSRIEILRGPQSALYGGDSIGGVIGLYSRRGTGDPSGRIFLEAGSHQSHRATLYLQGELDRLAYAISIGYQQTDNDLPNNRFIQHGQSIRLDYAASDSLDIGLTLRSFQSDLRRPNYADPNFARAADDRTVSTLATVFATLRVNEILTSKLTLGIYREDYHADTFASPRYYETDGEKHGIYWDNTLRWNDRHTTTAGAVFEKTDYTYASLFFSLSQDSRSSNQHGFYLHHSWDVTDALTLNGGIRWEDYDNYGDEFTWRSSIAYRISSTGTKFRASAGKGFRPPSYQELFGFGGGSNFSLRAESSSGWDLGIDQELCDGQYRLNVTWFENRIEDMIDSNFGPAPDFVTTYFNAPGTSVTRGLEIEAKGKWLNDRLETTLNYTWLDKTLSGQPKHSAGLQMNGKICDNLEAGFTVIHRDNRTFGGNELDSYIVTNLHANYQINENISLNTRVENLFNEDHELASFGNGASRSTYPGRGRGIFGGVTISW